MNKKILTGLIILGLIFAGSETYALFNGNLLLNDVASDIQTNDTSLSNNQPNIQNNQSNNIIIGENSNSIHMANVVLNVISDINDNGIVNDDVGQKVVKEIRRVTANDRVYVFYDDSSFSIMYDNFTSNSKFVLNAIYDADGVSGGYIVCTDCGNFIPVGDVSSLVLENYLCNCPDEHPTSVKDVPWVYSEESVLEHIKWAEYCKNNVKNVVDDSFDVDSAGEDTGDNINVSDEVTQENVENNYVNIEDSYSPIVLPSMSDHMNLQWIEPQLMNPSFNNEDS